MEATLDHTMQTMKIKDLISFLCHRKGFDLECAFHYLYSSDLYSRLKIDDAKMWYMSSEALYNELEEEKLKKEIKPQLNDKEMMFCSFCVENYIQYKNVKNPETVLYLFSIKGVFSFILEHYEVLHTQSVDYIVGTLDDYIANQD